MTRNRKLWKLAESCDELAKLSVEKKVSFGQYCCFKLIEDYSGTHMKLIPWDAFGKSIHRAMGENNIVIQNTSAVWPNFGSSMLRFFLEPKMNPFALEWVDPKSCELCDDIVKKIIALTFETDRGEGSDVPGALRDLAASLRRATL